MKIKFLKEEKVHVFNIRSEGSIFKIDLFSNKYLIGAFILGAILQISVVIIPSCSAIFEVQNLTKEQWMYTAIISIMPIFIMEFQKWFNSIISPKKYCITDVKTNFEKTGREYN